MFYVWTKILRSLRLKNLEEKNVMRKVYKMKDIFLVLINFIDLNYQG